MTSRRRKITFWATKKASKPVTVRFITSDGELVRFKASKKVSKPTRVSFYVKKRKR